MFTQLSDFYPMRSTSMILCRSGRIFSNEASDICLIILIFILADHCRLTIYKRFFPFPFTTKESYSVQKNNVVCKKTFSYSTKIPGRPLTLQLRHFSHIVFMLCTKYTVESQGRSCNHWLNPPRGR